jgi:two-component system NtrC family sensor kinase
MPMVSGGDIQYWLLGHYFKMTIMVEIFLFISLLINLSLGFLVSTRPSTHRRINVIFSLLCLACAFWILGALMIPISREVQWKLFWIRFIFGVSSFIPATLVHFSLVFPVHIHRINFLKTLILYLPPLIVLAFTPTELIVKSVVQLEPIHFEYGVMHRFVSIYFAIYLILGFYFLLRTYRNSKGVYRLQIKYCFIGMFLAAVTGFTTNLLLPTFGTSKFSALGPCSTIIMVGFITYSIVKHRLMDIDIVLKKGTTYILLLLLLFVPSFLLILLGQKLFFFKISYLFTVLVVALIFLVTLFFYRIKPHTEKIVEQFLFKNRYDYRETLGNFSKAMVSILDLKSLAKRIFETITQTMGVEKGSLFLWNDEKAGYSLYESKNISRTASTPLIPKDDPLPHYLQKMGEITIREELAKGANIPQLKDIVNKMSLLEAEATIPFISKGQLVGMINLGYKFTRDIYSHEDIELLGTLANQTAVAIENARLYEDLKRSKSYIRRADRLASLGTLTAGLAHEIRNPLVAIKTLTQLLPERLDDEEFRSQFLKIASGEVDRISSLVNELLDFARPSDPKWALEDINTILDGMILLVSTETKKKLITIIKNYASNLPPAQIDREQIKQVILNILLNAIDATPENGKIMVKTRSFIKPGGEPYVQIEFTDTGCGIPGEHLEDIFNPFFTTKATGSGLGLSISNQIVQDHKGYIDVESQLEKGSSFFVNLPVKQDHLRRRTRDLENNRNISNIVEER